MKFKTIFVIFNIVIVCSFLFIFFMPLILLGGEHFSIFFLNNWYIGVLFLLTLALFNLYFVLNWQLFQLLEQEDWKALIEYLEKRIYKDNVLRHNHIKILINAYLVTSNTDSILQLNSHLSQKKPELVNSFALQFGIPYLLDNKPEESEKFFGKLLAKKNIKDVNWIRWNYGFSLLQLKESEGAKNEFIQLIGQKKDPIVGLLSLYLLNSFSDADMMLRAKVDEGINNFLKTHTQSQWTSRVERLKGNIQVLILSKIINEASNWIFQYKPTANSETIH